MFKRIVKPVTICLVYGNVKKFHLKSEEEKPDDLLLLKHLLMSYYFLHRTFLDFPSDAVPAELVSLTQG